MGWNVCWPGVIRSQGACFTFENGYVAIGFEKMFFFNGLWNVRPCQGIWKIRQRWFSCCTCCSDKQPVYAKESESTRVHWWLSFFLLFNMVPKSCFFFQNGLEFSLILGFRNSGVSFSVTDAQKRSCPEYFWSGPSLEPGSALFLPQFSHQKCRKSRCVYQ